jgi:hypothetical protein
MAIKVWFDSLVENRRYRVCKFIDSELLKIALVAADAGAYNGQRGQGAPTMVLHMHVGDALVRNYRGVTADIDADLLVVGCSLH